MLERPGCLLRKAAGNEENHTRQRSSRLQIAMSIKAGPHKPFRAHIQAPHALFALMDVRLTLTSSLLFMHKFFTSGDENVYSVTLYIGSL